MPQVTQIGNDVSSPRWAGDFYGREHLMPFPARLDASQFRKTDAVVVTLTANALADAVSLTVAALAGPLPNGTTLVFGGKKFATLTAAAAAGATTLSVGAIPTAMSSGDSAVYAGSGEARKTVLSGTPVGRTFTERDNKAGFGPAADTDDEFYLIWSDVPDADKNPDVELYRPGSVVRENYLPGWAGLASGIKAKIRALYRCIIGRD